ncbi:MAG: helix-turn-helix transcriptional regulator [Bacteroidales bacterium]|jgi:transcriptional regulator with XRE-family HTH domain|nr:helix-turn-helix transcriptional regulator [Bacteroidales bacterium]
MNNRLQQFLAAENISQSQFADSIQVARASVSHILAGRNKPGFDFLERMARRYPNLSLEWMISGRGKMYKGQEDLTAEPFDEPEEEDRPVPSKHPSLFEDQDLPSSKEAEPEDPERRISKIVVFYDNGTYREVF